MDKDNKLFRKVNTTAHNVSHDKGSDFSEIRIKGKSEENDPLTKKMGTKNRGLDYTPLYRFLIASVGKNWDDVFKEVKNRLDKIEPIFYLVAKSDIEKEEIVRVGESTYFSGLYITEEGKLNFVNKYLTIDFLYPPFSTG